MGSEGAIKGRLFGRIFEPSVDFYEMLSSQTKKTYEGVSALFEWINEGSCEERCQKVRDLEKEADTLKFRLSKDLVESFITPFDREDIYELSNYIDEVINAAKDIAREIEAFETKPDLHPAIKDMTAILVEGTGYLVASVDALKHNSGEASAQAVMARKAESRLAKAYRLSMRELFNHEDVKVILRVKEVYKAILLCGERIDSVGEKLLHAIIKMA